MKPGRPCQNSPAMQVASGPPYQAAILGMEPRFRGQSPRNKPSFKFWGAASFLTTRSGPNLFLNPGAKPFELFALLLFALPLVFTLQKLFELLAFTERSHQLQAEPSGLVLLSPILSSPLPSFGSCSTVSCHYSKRRGFSGGRCYPPSSTSGKPCYNPRRRKRNCSPRSQAHSKT